VELARAIAASKRFGAVTAVKDVTCAFQAGEIHAVCGENGAGKSTLLKMVAGMLVPDEGAIRIGDAPLEPATPREAIRRGVAMVLQHFALVPVFTALENIMLGAEPGARGLVDRAAARARAEAVARELGVTLPLDTRVEDLGVGDRQRIEIARALFREAKLVILDEPTAVLTKTEAGALYTTMRRLAEAGKGIVVVTHKMDEVRAHADVVSVMRRGELVFTRALDRAGDMRAQVDAVTQAIMGAVALRERTEAKAAEAPEREAEPVIALENVSVGRALDGVSLSVRRGEIVGVAGVEGNGQRELVAVLAGDVKPDAGAVRGTEKRAIVREDRHAEGLVLDASLRDNVLLGELGSFERALGVLDRKAMDREATARIERSGAPRDLDREARTLSGGNQQKIVMARALARQAELLVAAQPTRGVDLAASIDIRRDLSEAAANGAGVVIVSSDLDELRALASRIVVLARGRIAVELPPTATDEELGRSMLGLGEDA
jgi:general nucleoside transport system ATP-binding protein